MKRRAEPRIVDINRHPKSSVNLEVAAEFLGVNARTVRARIESGELNAWRDGKVYRIAIDALKAYRDQHSSQ